MFKIIRISSAFIGVTVGAGFASGQEVLQYFTSFGLLGMIGAIVATCLLAYLGMKVMKIGAELQATSHKEAIYTITSPFIGKIIDYIIVLALFGVGVVMIAGAGSVFNQQFGLESYVGSLLMTCLIIGTMMLNTKNIITVIGSITPVLIIAVISIFIYSLVTIDLSIIQLDKIAQSKYSPFPNWFISSINYVSFNIAVGASMLFVIGGAEKDTNTAKWGGFFGGLGVGILIILINLAIFIKINIVSSYDMPLLKIVDNISPLLAVFMTLILFGMIFNSAVSVFYGFVARFFTMETNLSKIAIVIACMTAFMASFVGFTKLVSYFYPLIGYLGIVLIIALIYSSIKSDIAE